MRLRKTFVYRLTIYPEGAVLCIYRDGVGGFFMPLFTGLVRMMTKVAQRKKIARPGQNNKRKNIPKSHIR